MHVSGRLLAMKGVLFPHARTAYTLFNLRRHATLASLDRQDSTVDHSRTCYILKLFGLT
jgi:hypothetical protein